MDALRADPTLGALVDYLRITGILLEEFPSYAYRAVTISVQTERVGDF